MTKRLIAIAFIYVFTSIAWMVLGATVFERSQSSDRRLRGRVSSTWGSPQYQQAPTAFVEKVETQMVTPAVVRRQPPVAPPGTTTTAVPDVAAPARMEVTRTRVPISLEHTRVSVAFDLEHRQKGLLWYSTYGVGFDGTWRFRNTSDADSIVVEFRLPTPQAIYDDLRVTINGAAVPYRSENQALLTMTRVPRGDAIVFGVAYRSQGLDEWRYALGHDVAQVRDFELAMRTNFEDVDFPESTLSPTNKREIDGGWELHWRYANLLSGFQIGMDMPRKLQPGPLAGRIAFFAPISLLFFFALMFIIVTIRRIDLHPMNYAFLAAAFFSFHVLLVYLADHVSIHLAFLIASVVSISLVVSYLRLAVGHSFAFREAATAQFIYLVLFSYAFFFEGFTGLAITIGSVITLFAAMQLTGRVRWSEVFAGSARTP